MPGVGAVQGSRWRLCGRVVVLGAAPALPQAPTVEQLQRQLEQRDTAISDLLRRVEELERRVLATSPSPSLALALASPSPRAPARPAVVESAEPPVARSPRRGRGRRGEVAGAAPGTFESMRRRPTARSNGRSCRPARSCCRSAPSRSSPASATCGSRMMRPWSSPRMELNSSHPRRCGATTSRLGSRSASASLSTPSSRLTCPTATSGSRRSPAPASRGSASGTTRPLA
jgi:hypothetical protein